VFASTVVPSIVMIPAPFQYAPPSAEAVFPLAVPPVMFESPGPDMCNPPPLPGADAVLLFIKSTFVNVNTLPATEFSSIAPPARIELFPLNSESVTVKVP